MKGWKEIIRDKQEAGKESVNTPGGTGKHQVIGKEAGDLITQFSDWIYTILEPTLNIPQNSAFMGKKHLKLSSGWPQFETNRLLPSRKQKKKVIGTMKDKIFYGVG